MNILFLTQTDIESIDERGIYTDLLRFFMNKGHSISILSPSNKGLNKKITEKGVDIIKFSSFSKTSSFIKKGFDLLTIERKYLSNVKRFFSKTKFDLILYTTPPITTLKAIKYIKKRDKAIAYLLLKDIFPQNAVDLGILTKRGFKGIIYKFFRNKEKKLYKVSDYIGCMSKANVDFIKNNNKFLADKIIEVTPNSIDVSNLAWRNETSDEIRKKYSLPLDKIIYIYGGNLGKPQGVYFLKDIIMNNPNIYVLIVGDGTEFNNLKEFFENIKPENAMLISKLEKEEYENLVKASDVGLILLDKRFTIPNYPSRLLSYMAASIPIIAATDVNTDIGAIAEKNGYGYWCQNGDIDEFNRIAVLLENKEMRIQMGIKGRKYLEMNYTVKNTYNSIMKHFL